MDEQKQKKKTIKENPEKLIKFPLNIEENSLPWFIALLIESIIFGVEISERKEPADHQRRFMNRDCHIEAFFFNEILASFHIITFEKKGEKNAFEAEHEDDKMNS